MSDPCPNCGKTGHKLCGRVAPQPAPLTPADEPVDQRDVDLFVASLRAKGTPWATGCARIMLRLWADHNSAREAAEAALREAGRDAERMRKAALRVYQRYMLDQFPTADEAAALLAAIDAARTPDTPQEPTP